MLTSAEYSGNKWFYRVVLMRFGFMVYPDKSNQIRGAGCAPGRQAEAGIIGIIIIIGDKMTLP